MIVKNKKEPINHSNGNQLGSSFEFLQTNIFLIDNNYTIIYANKSACHFLGYTKEELLSQKMEKILYLKKSHVIADIAKGLGKYEKYSAHELIFKCKNGSLSYVVAYIALFSDNLYIFHYYDITERKIIEKEFEKKSLLLSENQQYTKMGNWALSSSKIFTEWSNEVYAIFNLVNSGKLLSFEQFIDYIHPIDRRKVINYFEKAVHEKIKIKKIEYRIKLKSGKIKYIQQYTRQGFKSNSRVNYIYGTMQDISDRKRIERELLQSEGKFKNIFNSSPVGMYLYSLNKEGKLILTDANPSVNNQTGFDHAPLIGKTIQEALPGLSHTNVFQILIKVACNGEVWDTANLLYKDRNIEGIFDVYAFQTSIGNLAIMFIEVSDRKKAELKLKESEEKYRKLVDSSIVGIFKSDLKGKIEFANKSYQNIFNYKNQHYLKEIFLFDNFKRKSDSKKFLRLLENDNKISLFQIEAITQTGRTIHININAVLENQKISGTIMDISEKVEADQKLLKLNNKLQVSSYKVNAINNKLKESNERYYSLFNNTGTAMCIFNKEGVVTLCNFKFEELTGYYQHEIENKKKFIDFFCENEKERLSKYISSYKITGEKKVQPDIDFSLICSKNIYKYTHIEFGILTHTDERIASLTDITQRKKTEEALVESEIQKWAFLNTLPHLAWLKDKNGKFIIVNESYAKSRNRAISEIVGKTDYDLYPQKLANRYISQDKEIIKSKNLCFYQEKSGNKWFDTFKAPILNAENVVTGITGISLEITQRKKAEDKSKAYSKKLSEQNEMLRLINEELVKAKEKAEESDKLKSAFLANMSHEIRTPMNAILGFASLLKYKKFSEDRKTEFIDIINAKSNQLLQIITDIIDISKIEADQINIFNKNFSVNELLQQLAIYFNTLKAQEKKDLGFDVIYGLADNNAWIYSDKVRIEQILTNLLSNAFKFTEMGKVELGYTILRGKTIRFYVKDTGIGLTEEEKKIIFDRFRQASSSFNRLYGGTGLGLSISKGLAAKLDGKINVESTINEGSIFYLSIPYVRGEKSVRTATIAKNKYNWKNKTILIAEDEDINFSFIETLLKPTEVNIIRVKDGINAVSLCKNKSDINLVLMDIKLPELDGLTATKEIKKFRKTLPVIAQTAYAMSSDEECCIQSGCDAYVSKPIKIEPFLKLIDQYIM